MVVRYSSVLLVLILAINVPAQQTSKTSPLLKQALELYPEADANHDGVLTRAEARDYQRKLQGDRSALETEAFRSTAAELDKRMQADNASLQEEPLKFEKGNGLRILMTGHSWVAPARISLPRIAQAAGLDGHHQRSHTSGGAKGSASSIWLSEIGQFNGEPARPILRPAIETGQWDVMTWGAFYGDKPEDYSQWIDLCLKHNPKIVFYIQDGWPTFRPEMKNAMPQEAIRAIDAQQPALHRMFQALYDALNSKYPGKVHILPAGDAVVRILHLYNEKKLPGFDCVSEHLGGKKGVYRDGGHLSSNSGMGYLIGYVYYGTLYKRSPELIPSLPEGAPKEIDALLRTAAWQSVIHSPWSGVTDENGNGIADEAEATGLEARKSTSSTGKSQAALQSLSGIHMDRDVTDCVQAGSIIADTAKIPSMPDSRLYPARRPGTAAFD